MLHLFKRNGDHDGSPIDSLDGSIVVSHILVKFLKRLRHMDRPHLLDLGRVSGSNIEFFVQAGCKVRVEDLLIATDQEAAQATAIEERAFGGPPAPQASQDRPMADGISLASDSGVAAPASPLPSGAPGRPAAATGQTSAILRPGARPSRRIVLPPRTFASTRLQEKHPGSDVASRPGRPAPL